jgi:pilus assembly protein CpaC
LTIPTWRRRGSVAALVLALMATCVPNGPATMANAAQAVPVTFARLTLIVGRSRVLIPEFDVMRVAVTNPAVADVLVIDPRQLLIDGRSVGTVSLILWGADRREQYDVVVEAPPSTLQQQLRTLFPAEDIRVAASEEALVLSGRVSSHDISARAVELAQASASKLKVINWIEGPPGAVSQQVMLQVRFAEVSRNALDELGVQLFASRQDLAVRTTTQQFNAPEFDVSDQRGLLRFGDFLNLFYISANGLGFAIRALEQTGQFQTLAEPNLIAYNGQEASFLAGGELPIPIVQGVGATSAVSVQYKEFGVRLTFRPTITGDLIRLRVKPEVSAPDPANGITIGGINLPALSTRRADTEIEVRDGQSFAIAGLLNNRSDLVEDAIPLLSKLPIIGHLFRSHSDRRSRNELLVLITPHLVRPFEPAEVPPLPTDSDRFLAPPGDGLGSALDGGGGLVDAPPPGNAPDGGRP